MSVWSDWLRFQNEGFQGIPQSPGVYEIRWVNEGEPQPIRRVDGVDKSGLLYIGKSRKLQSRIRGFWRYLRKGKGKHRAGKTYVSYDYERKFKPDQLEVRWMTIPDGEVDEEEARLLDEYVNEYLDRPPLNIIIKRLY